MDPDRAARFQIRYGKLYAELDGLDTTDVTIRLRDGTELRAHREVLEGESAFFQNALKPGTFKESFTGVVHFPNDPPRAVRAMIEYFYLFNYMVPSDRSFMDFFMDFDFADEVSHHLDMLNIAHVYMLDELYVQADRKLAGLIYEHWSHMKDNMFLIFELLDALDTETKSYMELYTTAARYMEAFTEDDVWTKLHERAPDFITLLKWQSECEWYLLSCRGAGMFLDRLGGEDSVGMVYHQMKCPTCGLVQEAALGLVKPARIRCWNYGGGECSCWAPSDEWFDVTKDNQRKNKKKRKAKKQQKEKKVKRKAAKKKNSRG